MPAVRVTRRALVASGILFVLTGGSCGGPREDGRVDPGTGCVLEPVRIGSVVGTSGLTVTPAGRLVAISENRRLLELIRDAGGWRSLRSSPIPGLGEGIDTEAIAAWADGSFWIGTEGRGRRTSDPIYRVEWTGEEVRIVDHVLFSYAPFGLEAPDNKGVEGLCASGDWLLAAAEPVIQTGAARFAPILLYDGARGAVYPYRLRLSTEEGKVSSLSCRIAESGALDVIAIERHFGIGRLLRFALPLPDREADHSPAARIEPIDLTPVVEDDLATRLHPLPNFEGIAPWQGGWILINDNHYGSADGPTYLFDPSCPAGNGSRDASRMNGLSE